MRQDALRKEEELHLRIKHEAELQAATSGEGGGTAGTPASAGPPDPRLAWERAQSSSW
jgi:hypothetical protein